MAQPADADGALIRPMRSAAELQLAYDWARREGWWPGVDDALLGAASDPDGWFCAERDSTIVALVCGLRLSPTLGFIGLYICDPAHRGRGHGLAVFQRALAYLGERNVALDAVEAQVHNYAKSGFRPAYKTWRLAGAPSADELALLANEPAADGADPAITSSEAPNGLDGGEIRRVEAADVAALAAWDERCVSGYERGAFLAALAAAPSTDMAAAYDERGGVLGVVAVRPALGQDGATVARRIGPLLASSLGTAIRLLRWAVAQSSEAGGGTYALDVPDRNAAFLDALEGAGFQKQWGCVRMYTKGEPAELQLDKLYAISTWEVQLA